MRSVLALCLLIALCASANAAARGHHAKSRDVIVRPSQAVIPSYATPGVRIYRDEFRVVCGPTTTTLLPTMIHPSLAAADLGRPDDVYAKVSRVTWRKADVRPFVIKNSCKRNGVSR
jgi:hypothetical protein